MTVNNAAKFWLLLVALVGLLALVVAGQAELGDVDAYLTLIIGYGVGNGIAAVRGQPTTAVFGPKHPTDGG